jgi:glutathione synthase/RimK-type ligase-like ATP-grasp enzyme
LDTDLFPTDLQLSIGWDKTDRLRLSSLSDQLDLSRVRSVWVRHTDPGADLPLDLDPSHREAARAESDSTVFSLIECLDVYQLDPPESLRRAPYKPRQLQLARAAGLEIPRTLITNNPQAVRDFADTCRNGMIAKMVDGSSVGVGTTTGSEPIYTTHLSPQDLEELDSIHLCPMIFQEAVPKAIELRITVVGASVFVAAVDSNASVKGSDDWRKDKSLVQGFYPFDDCPKDVLDRILELLNKVALDFATVDMIVTPDGRYVFLELNSVSYFDFVERATGFPISGAIADLLLGLAPSRTSTRKVRHNGNHPR